jgi:hypothetical protein
VWRRRPLLPPPAWYYSKKVATAPAKGKNKRSQDTSDEAKEGVTWRRIALQVTQSLTLDSWSAISDGSEQI